MSSGEIKLDDAQFWPTMHRVAGVVDQLQRPILVRLSCRMTVQGVLFVPHDCIETARRMSYGPSDGQAGRGDLFMVRSAFEKASCCWLTGGWHDVSYVVEKLVDNRIDAVALAIMLNELEACRGRSNLDDDERDDAYRAWWFHQCGVRRSDEVILPRRA